MNSIKAKYAEFVLAPGEALSGVGDGVYMTLDGKECRAQFISIWDNRDGRYDDELEHICQRYYSLSFSYMKSLWMERVKSIEGYWYLIHETI